MGFIGFGERGWLVDPEGNPVYIVGINYVASYICSNFWEDWRPEVIEKDLRRVSELGLNAVRIPMHWGFMEPEQGRYNPVIVERFDIFLGYCKKYRLYVMPWFLVGIATREYDVPFRNGRQLFTGEMVEVAENHLKNFIKHYINEEQILFWDICDEPEWYSRLGSGAEQLPYDRKVMAKWVKSMYDAIKSVDPNHLVTLGFGHIATADYGMHIRDMAEILDLMAITAYPYMSNEAADSYRNNYFIPYNVKFNCLTKPVFTCEAPGFTSILLSEEIIARFFKVSLYSNLINGSTGVMPWVFNDFDKSLWYECPFDKYTIEPSFGIVTVDGRLKPSGIELSEFARFVKENDITRYSFKKSETAILIPKGYYSEIANTSIKLYISFILAKGCSIDVDFVWDDEDISGYKLVIMPSTAQLSTQAWDQIREYVENGGNIYHIYDNRNGLNVYFNELFGVEVQTPEKDFGYDRLCMKQEWGIFNEGQSIELVGSGRNEYLKVKAVTAEVICEFDDATPAIIKNRYGKGCAFFSASPIENGLMDIRNSEFLNNKLFGIYDALIDESCINQPVKSMDSRIEIGCMEDRDTGEMLAVCINHDYKEVQTRLYIDLIASRQKTEILDTATGDYIKFDEGEMGTKYFDTYFTPAGVKVYKIKA